MPTGSPLIPMVMGSPTVVINSQTHRKAIRLMPMGSRLMTMAMAFPTALIRSPIHRKVIQSLQTALLLFQRKKQ